MWIRLMLDLFSRPPFSVRQLPLRGGPQVHCSDVQVSYARGCTCRDCARLQLSSCEALEKGPSSRCSSKQAIRKTIV